MPIQLYDLAGADSRLLFSPFSWRIRMALLHKGLDFDVVPWRFCERAAIEPSGHDSIPVILDGDRWVGDSWDIALYLDRAYPDRPALMKDAESQAAARLMMALCGAIVFPAAIRVAVYQAYQILDERCQAYFRESRETMFGAKLEDIHAEEETAKAGLADALRPFEELLGACEFIGGDHPTYADYVLFGLVKWMDIVSRYRPLDSTTSVGAWFARLEDLYGGHAGSVATVRSLQ